jgi:hypothetical protein
LAFVSLTAGLAKRILARMENSGFTHGKGRRLPAILFGIAAITAVMALPSLALAQDASTVDSSGSFAVGKGDHSNTSGSGSTATLDAATPTGDQYSDTTNRINSFTAASPSSGSGTSGGGLPFTGFDVGLVALIGAALLGSGFLIRRLGRGQLDA